MKSTQHNHRRLSVKRAFPTGKTTNAYVCLLVYTFDHPCLSFNVIRKLTDLNEFPFLLFTTKVAAMFGFPPKEATTCPFT